MGRAAVLGCLCTLLWLAAAAVPVTAQVTAPDYGKPIVQNAQRLIQAGNHAEAARILEALVGLEPRNADAFYWLGVAYQGQRRPDLAAQAYFRASVIRPDDERTMGALARIHAQGGDVTRSLYWYRRLLARRPGDEKLGLEAADVALRHHKDLEAEFLLKDLVTQNPRARGAWLKLAEIHFSSGFYEEAAVSLQQSAQLAPLSQKQRRMLIDAYILLGRPAEAVTYLREAVARQPDNAELYALLGQCELEAGAPERAATAFRTALRLDASASHLHLPLARSLAIAGQFSDALEVYEKALALPSAVQQDILLEAAQVAVSADRSDLARIYAARLVALSPADPALRQFLVSRALADNHLDTALAQLGELQRIETGAAGAAHLLRRMQLALAMGADERAGELARQAAMIPGIKPADRLNVAEALLAVGERTEAAQEAREVLKQVKDDIPTATRAADVLRQAGHVGEAEVAFKRLLEKNPGNVRALVGLAGCLTAGGEGPAGMELLHVIIEEDGSSPFLPGAFADAAEAAGMMPQAIDRVRRTVITEPQATAAVDCLAEVLRRMGGEGLAARELAALTRAHPANLHLRLLAARYAAAVGRHSDAAEFYQALREHSDYAEAAQNGLLLALMAAERHMDVLTALGRRMALRPSDDPLRELVLAAAADPQLHTEAAARAALDLHFAREGSEAYYLALAELYAAVGRADRGIAVFGGGAKTGRSAAQSLALARLLGLRELDEQALERLAEIPPAQQSPRVMLERARTYLRLGREAEAAHYGRRAVIGASQAVAAEAFMVTARAEAAIRPEESLWLIGQAVHRGAPQREAALLMVQVCDSASLPAAMVSRALDDLRRMGRQDFASTVAAELSAREGFADLRRFVTIPVPKADSSNKDDTNHPADSQ